MRYLLVAIMVLCLSACSWTQEQIRAEGIAAAKCLSVCAIQCSTSGAIAASCGEFSAEAAKAQAIVAAQCMAACAIQCGAKAAAAAQAAK